MSRKNCLRHSDSERPVSRNCKSSFPDVFFRGQYRHEMLVDLRTEENANITLNKNVCNQ